MTQESLKGHLDKLISDEDYTKIELGYIPPSKMYNLLKNIDEVDLTIWMDFETNGWDVDFWFTFKYKNISLDFSGSWYSGDYSIYKN